MRACITWENFHESMGKAKKVLERNQYPPLFYDPIIKETITSIVQKPASEPSLQQPPVMPDESARPAATDAPSNPVPKKMIFVQYRGKGTEDYARALHKYEAPVKIVMTMRKLKTTMPSLKPQIEKELRSGTVYRITCPSCEACYVGQTSRHLLTRYKEHTRPSAPVRKHFDGCAAHLSFENMDTLKSSARGEAHLLTMEALFIEEMKPSINTRDEYRSRALTIRLY